MTVYQVVLNERAGNRHLIIFGLKDEIVNDWGVDDQAARAGNESTVAQKRVTI
jgi:hypothetical protein